jgi:sugar phosphate isomerase/epimerase
MIHELADCLAMVEGAAAPNGGLIVDIAHANAFGISKRAGGSDLGPLHDQRRAERQSARELPGPRSRRAPLLSEGELDVRGFVAAARSTGYAGPWAVEVFNHGQAGWMQEKLNRQAIETTGVVRAPCGRPDEGADLTSSLVRRSFPV